MTIIITPDTDTSITFLEDKQIPEDMREHAMRAFRTVQFLEKNGMKPTPITEADRKAARSEFLGGPGATKKVETSGKARMLKALLDEYDVDVVRSAVQIRSYVKLKLLELSTSPSEKTQLKALELLGKMSDVNAFSENVTITVNNQTTEEIEAELAKKLEKYLADMDVSDAVYVDPVLKAPAPAAIDLTEELGK